MKDSDVLRGIETMLMGEPGKPPPDVVVKLGLHGPLDERVEQLINRAELLRAENAELREEKRELEAELHSYRSRSNFAERLAEEAKEEVRRATNRCDEAIADAEREERRADRAEDKVRALEWALVKLHKEQTGGRSES